MSSRVVRGSFATSVALALAIGTFAAEPARAVAVPALARAVATPSPSVDWPSYNNDVGSSRYAAVAGITVANVASLRTLCSVKLGTTPQRFENGPIVVAGVAYVTTVDHTYALDAATCAAKWTSAYTLSPASTGGNHGVAYSSGRVFRGFLDGHVVALDAATGHLDWNVSLRAALPSGSTESIISAPIVSAGRVIIGTAGGDSGQMCHVAAFDQTTGKLLWLEQTVPKPTDPAASTWKGAKRIAGGATWSSFTVDTASSKLYVPVGNPGPDFDVRLRTGSDSFTDAVVEVNPGTGAMERAFQAVSQDDHDWDMSSTPAIATVKSGARVALVAGKDGYLRSVLLTSFKQTWAVAVTTIANATAPIATSGTHFCPGKGSVFWNGPAYSQLTGYAYVNATDWCSTVDLSATPQPYVAGRSWLGSSDSYGTSDSTKSGWLDAVDATTGAMKWRYHAATPLISGVTTTSSGLVFTADLAGYLYAFDATSGAMRARVSLGSAVGGGVIAYEVAGKPYVAVAAGLSSPVFNTPNVTPTFVVLGL